MVLMGHTGHTGHNTEKVFRVGISVRAYARARGVSDTAVRKAIKVGRITPEPDGMINPATADAQWLHNIDQALQRKPRAEARQALPPRSPAPPERPLPQVSKPETSVTPPTAGGSSGTSLLQARTANEVLKAQTNKVRLARMKGELIERSQAMAQVFKLARAELDAWLNWPARVSAQLASGLAVGAHTVHVLLEAAVREHLSELGEVAVRVD
jgi:hypothetical protein